MSLQTPFPTPVGPFTLEPSTDSTERLETVEAGLVLDALPLLDHHQRTRTIEPHHALRGPHLALQDGGLTRLLRLDQDITHLGRGSAAHVRLDEQRVSRDHAILVRHGRYFRLLDNRSANGTFVNGRRIVTTNIRSGDVIEVGPVRLQFLDVQ
jgi:hypothetical protein